MCVGRNLKFLVFQVFSDFLSRPGRQKVQRIRIIIIMTSLHHCQDWNHGGRMIDKRRENNKKNANSRSN